MNKELETIIKSLAVDKWLQKANHSTGRADQISDILERFNGELPDHITSWLLNTRTVAREEATVSFKQANELSKGDQ